MMFLKDISILWNWKLLLFSMSPYTEKKGKNESYFTTFYRCINDLRKIGFFLSFVTAANFSFNIWKWTKKFFQWKEPHFVWYKDFKKMLYFHIKSALKIVEALYRLFINIKAKEMLRNINIFKFTMSVCESICLLCLIY